MVGRTLQQELTDRLHVLGRSWRFRGKAGRDGLEAAVKVRGTLAILQLWWRKHQGLLFEGFPGKQCLRAKPDSANKKVMGVFREELDHPLSGSH